MNGQLFHWASLRIPCVEIVSLRTFLVRQPIQMRISYQWSSLSFPFQDRELGRKDRGLEPLVTAHAVSILSVPSTLLCLYLLCTEVKK